MTALERVADLALKPEPKLKAGPSPDKVMTSFRLPPELQRELKALAAFWTKQDRRIAQKLYGDADKAAVTTATDVVERLLTSGIAGAWDEMGGKPGNKKDEEALLERSVQNAVKQFNQK